MLRKDSWQPWTAACSCLYPHWQNRNIQKAWLWRQMVSHSTGRSCASRLVSRGMSFATCADTLRTPLSTLRQQRRRISGAVMCTGLGGLSLHGSSAAKRDNRGPILRKYESHNCTAGCVTKYMSHMLTVCMSRGSCTTLPYCCSVRKHPPLKLRPQISAWPEGPSDHQPQTKPPILEDCC